MAVVSSPIHSPIRSPLRSPLAGKWDGGVTTPDGALVDRAVNYILDRNGNYIVTATAARTS